MKVVKSHDHPSSRLYTHSKAVANHTASLMRLNVLDKYSELSDFISNIIGHLHDIMKDTDDFQARYEGGAEKGIRNRHSGGAFIAYIITDLILKNNPEVLKDCFLRSYLPMLVFHICGAHHSEIKSVNMAEYDESLTEWLNTHSDISAVLIDKAQDGCGVKSGIDDVKIIVKTAMEKNVDGYIRTHIQKIFEKMNGTKYNDFYFLTRLFLGAMVEADVRSAKRQSRGVREPKVFKDELAACLVKVDIEAVLKKNGVKPDELKTMFQNDVIGNASKFSGGGVYLVVGDTSMGKTLTMAGVIQVMQNSIPCKVHYYAPRINILDQNKNVLFDTVVQGNSLLLHHLKRETMNEENTSTFNRDIFGDHGFILTTYNKFMRMFTSDRRYDCVLMSSVKNSIFVFDECQTFNVFQFQKIAPLISSMVEYCGAKFFFVSATPPTVDRWDDALRSLLCERHDRMIPLVSEEFTRLVKTKPKITRRRECVPLPDIHDLTNLSNVIDRFRVFNPKYSTLASLNLASDVIRLGDIMLGDVDYIISNYLRPMDISFLLKEITGRLRKGDPLLVIASSVIQSGLNLDFDSGFLDLSNPFDLAQILGRIGRWWKLMRGVCKAYIFSLLDVWGRNVNSWDAQKYNRMNDHQKEAYQHVYDATMEFIQDIMKGDSFLDSDLERMCEVFDKKIIQSHKWLVDQTMTDSVTFGTSMDSFVCGENSGLSFSNIVKYTKMDDDENEDGCVVLFMPEDWQEKRYVEMLIDQYDAILNDDFVNYEEKNNTRKLIYKNIAPFSLKRYDIIEQVERENFGVDYDYLGFRIVDNYPKYDIRKGGWRQ